MSPQSNVSLATQLFGCGGRREWMDVTSKSRKMTMSRLVDWLVNIMGGRDRVATLAYGNGAAMLWSL